MARVELSRNKGEGNNAFTYEQKGAQMEKQFFSINSRTREIALLTDYDTITKLHMKHKNKLFSKFNSNFQWIVILGNQVLGGYMADKMFKDDGYGFNKFHSLAINAQSVEELADLKAMNVIKKSNQTIDNITPFHCAVLNPNPQIFQYFIDIGKDLFVADMRQRKAIHYAAGSPFLHALEILHKNGVDGRETDLNRMTPLMYACIAGRLNNVKFLLDHYNYNINQKCKEGLSALHYAVAYNHLDVVKELFKRGADLNLPASKRKSCIIYAAVNGNFQMAEYLIQNGAKFLKTDAFRKNPLIYAIINGHVELTSYLLRLGSDFATGDSSNNTPLHYACAYGRYEIIGLLIAAGANPNVLNNWGYSPILVALIKKHMRCVEIMGDIPNIDVNIRDDKGRGFMFGLVYEFDWKSFNFLKKLIVERGGDPNQKDLEGNQLMHQLAATSLHNNLLDHDYYIQSLLQRENTEQTYQKDLILLKNYFTLLSGNNCNLTDKNVKDQSPIEIALINHSVEFLEIALQVQSLTF